MIFLKLQLKKIYATDHVVKLLQLWFDCETSIPKTVEELRKKKNLIKLDGKFIYVNYDQEKLNNVHQTNKIIQGFFGEDPKIKSDKIITVTKNGKETTRYKYQVDVRKLYKDLSNINIKLEFEKGKESPLKVPEHPPQNEETTEKDWVDKDIFKKIIQAMENKCLLKYLFDLNHVNHWNPKNNDSSQMTNAAEKKCRFSSSSKCIFSKCSFHSNPNSHQSILTEREDNQQRQVNRSIFPNYQSITLISLLYHLPISFIRKYLDRRKI